MVKISRNYLKSIIFIMIALTITLASSCTSKKTKETRVRVLQLKEMFTKVVEGKNANLISKYYDKEFELYSNGKKMTYCEFLDLHTKLYAKDIKYSVAYDEETLMQEGCRVAGRLFISLKEPGMSSCKIEVILIAEYKDNKLYRLWETTYPNWEQLKALKAPTREAPIKKTTPQFSKEPQHSQ